MMKGIRGATTVSENSIDDIKTATLELFFKLVDENNLKEENVSHIIFSLTKDITKAYPAKFVREHWNNVAMMCLNEADIENSLKMCIRILIVAECESKPKFVYINGAKDLRK